jgi:hypothetical protein
VYSFRDKSLLKYFSANLKGLYYVSVYIECSEQADPYRQKTDWRLQSAGVRRAGDRWEMGANVYWGFFWE